MWIDVDWPAYRDGVSKAIVFRWYYDMCFCTALSQDKSKMCLMGRGEESSSAALWERLRTGWKKPALALPEVSSKVMHSEGNRLEPKIICWMRQPAPLTRINFQDEMNAGAEKSLPVIIVTHNCSRHTNFWQTAFFCSAISLSMTCLTIFF